MRVGAQSLKIEQEFTLAKKLSWKMRRKSGERRKRGGVFDRVHNFSPAQKREKHTHSSSSSIAKLSLLIFIAPRSASARIRVSFTFRSNSCEFFVSLFRTLLDCRNVFQFSTSNLKSSVEHTTLQQFLYHLLCCNTSHF